MKSACWLGPSGQGPDQQGPRPDTGIALPDWGTRTGTDGPEGLTWGPGLWDGWGEPQGNWAGSPSPIRALRVLVPQAFQNYH